MNAKHTTISLNAIAAGRVRRNHDNAMRLQHVVARPAQNVLPATRWVAPSPRWGAPRTTWR